MNFGWMDFDHYATNHCYTMPTSLAMVSTFNIFAFESAAKVRSGIKGLHNDFFGAFRRRTLFDLLVVYIKSEVERRGYLNFAPASLRLALRLIHSSRLLVVGPKQ